MNGKKNHDDKQRRPGSGKDAHSRAPEYTHQEVTYIKYLIDNHIPVRVRLVDNEEIEGTIEYYDATFIRITREPEPNLFVFKHEIKYLYEIE